jgi:hypothetical protein
MIWIVPLAIYIAGFLVTGEIALLMGMAEYDWDRPVLTTLTYAFTWPLFAVWYTWRGIDMFVRHMIEEFTGG